jgi:predicted DNA-binding transcriptional regulator YafY
VNRDKDFSRPLKILLRLSEGQATRDQLAREFECHERTITRNIDTLRYAGFEVEEDYNQERRIFYYIDDDSVLSRVFNLNPAEMLALLAAQRSISSFSHTFLADAFDSLMERIWKHLPQPTKEWFNSLKGHVIFQGSHLSLPSKTTKILDLILDAISRRMMLEVHYLDKDGVTTERNISPIQLLQAPYRIYVIAYCHLRQDIRNFALDRIIDADFTGKSSQFPADFNIQAYIANAFLVYSTGPTQLVKIKLWGNALEVARCNTYHPSQKLVEEKTNGYGILTMEVASLEEVLKMLMGFCHEAEALEPEELRVLVKNRLSRMNKVYKMN